MPKIIENIEQKIYDSALKLFGEKGYDYVDMKSIAKEIGIAVGTLYNYYPNKEALFIDVFNKSWAETFKRIRVVKHEDASVIEQLKKMIGVLYEDVFNRKGLGSDLFRNNPEKMTAQEGLINIRDELNEIMGSIFILLQEQGNTSIEEYELSLLVETVIATIFILIRNHPEDNENNLLFLNRLIERYIR